MTRASIAAVKANFGDYIKTIGEAPLVVTRNGKPIALMLSVSSEEDIERLLMEQSPSLRKITDRSLKQIRAGKGVKSDAFWNELDSAAPGKRARKGKRPA